MKCIIYARVSTKDQNVDIQLTNLREFARARKLNVIKEYIDYASGIKSDRTNYKKLFDEVKKRKCDVIMVWKFDRFARSTKELINVLDKFKNLGIDLKTLNLH